MIELDQPDSIWNRAVQAEDQGDPFCSRTEWQLSFHETFPPRRPLHVATHDQSVLAFALRDHGDVTVYEPIDCNWLFGSPLLGPDAVPMLAELLASHPERPAIVSALPSGGARLHELVQTFAGRYELLVVAEETACTASLEGGLDGYLSRRSAKWRRGIRSAARRVAKAGVTFERHAPRSPQDVDPVYERVLAVEATSWKGIGRCGMAEPPSCHFYRAMLRRMAASGGGRVVFARHDGEDIGFVLGCVGSGVYRGQQFSFAEPWRRASLGNVLQLEQLSWLCEEGVARYDMGPLMDYKPHWTESRLPFLAIALRPR